MARVEHRILYGLVNDVLEVAAHYAMTIAMGHAFNDANKRTAFVAMDVFLRMNGYALSIDADHVIDMMVNTAAGHWTSQELADEVYKYLCELAEEEP